jgi:hypothetical protein
MNGCDKSNTTTFQPLLYDTRVLYVPYLASQLPLSIWGTVRYPDETLPLFPELPSCKCRKSTAVLSNRNVTPVLLSDV